jgi:hypothetical protein
VSPEQRWLSAVWPFVRGRLPEAPARVVKLGCGSLGLADTSEADERAAIAAGEIRPNRIDYVGGPR